MKNELNPYAVAQITNEQQNNSAAGTFDQRITPEVELFIEGFYSNRRVVFISPANLTPYGNLTLVTVTVPTANPFYPVGAPAGLRVSYSFSQELPPRSSGHELSGRFAGGFNLTLPYDWKGKLFASVNQENNFFLEGNSPNLNNISAALGNTVPATPAAGAIPGFAAFTKPANVPYLNLFCDPTAFQCNLQSTLDYINAYGISESTYIVQQFGATFDGPLFTLPAGDMKAAVGGDYAKDNYTFTTVRTRNSPAASVVQVVPDYEARSRWALFAQLNVPVFGESNATSLFNKLDLEISGRYDHYSDFGSTANYKVGLNWTLLDGLRLRGSMGTSFNAPTLAQISPVAARSIAAINLLAGATSNTAALCPVVGGTPAPGSLAAALNPTCSAALNFPAAIGVQGGSSGLNGILRPANYALQPEKSKNANLGVDFTPRGFLEGLDVSVTWYNVHIDNTIVAITDSNALISNPAFRSATLSVADPGFQAALTALLTSPQGSNVPAATASNITVILDSSSMNAGYLRQDGIDLTADYDWDMGAWGTGNVGIAGDYKFHQISALPGSAPIDLYRDSNGQPEAFRLTHRTHIGWNYEGYSATFFIDYTSHLSDGNPFPPAAFLAKFPNYSNKLPATFLFDLSLGYDTREEPDNAYLKNLHFQLVINNILNRDPPFAYNISSSTNGLVGYVGQFYSPYGRQIAFSVSKTW